MKKIILSAVLCLSLLLCACSEQTQDVPVSATELYLSCDVMNATVGEFITPGVTLLPKNADSPINFRISDETIVREYGGRLLAVNCGEAVITAFSGNVSDSMRVTVSDCTYDSCLSVVYDFSESPSVQTYSAMLSASDALSLCGTDTAQRAAGFLNALCIGDESVPEDELTGLGRDDIERLRLLCEAARQTETNDVVLSFVGDCTFAGFNDSVGEGRFPYVYEHSGSVTYPFDGVSSVFRMDTASIVNFEGTLTNSSIHPEKEFYFKGEPAYAQILPLSGVEFANLANNHSTDFFESGLIETADALTDAGVGCFYDDTPCIRKMKDADGKEFELVLLSACSSDVERPERIDALAQQVEKYRRDGALIAVSIHWGKELAAEPEQWQVTAAHRLADAGADIITGHHPHVLQGIECYNGTYIAYSLGNFSFGGNTKANNPETGILRACFDDDGGRPKCTGISFIPCLTTSSGSIVNDYRPCFAPEKQAQKIRKMILDRSGRLEYGIKEI